MPKNNHADADVTLNRADLVKKLTLAAQALASTDLVKIYADFWFTGEMMQAYNDQIGIAVTCKTPFVNATVRGKVFLTLISASKAENIYLNFDKAKSGQGGQLTMDLGKAHVELAAANYSKQDPILPPKPNEENRKAILDVDNADLWAAINLCLLSTTDNTAMTESLGVTLIATEERLGVYSVSQGSLSKATVAWKGKPAKFKQTIIPRNFCRAVLEYYNLAKEEPPALGVTNDGAMAWGNGIVFYTRVVDYSEPFEFENVLEREMPPKFKSKVVPIPENLTDVLTRAMAVLDTSNDRHYMEISVDNGRLETYATTPGLGSVEDETKIDDKHPKALAYIHPKALQTGLPLFDKIYVTDERVVLVNKYGLYMMATVDAHKEEEKKK